MQKKYSGLVQFSVLTLLGCVIVAALVAPNMLLHWQSRRAVQVSVIVRETDGSLYTNLRLGMEQAAYDLGCELRFLLPEESNSHTAQRALLLREAEAGTDAVVLMAANTAQMKPFVQQMKIPVIALESELGGVCVAPDNDALGEALAAACTAQQGTVLLLNTAPDSEGVQQRIAACAAALTQRGLTVQTELATVQTLAAQALPAEKDAAAVIAFEPSATQALSQPAHRPSLLYGVGNSETLVAALENGLLQAVAASSDYAAGYLAVQAACETVRGASAAAYPASSFRIIRKADIYEEENQKLLFPVVS